MNALIVLPEELHAERFIRIPSERAGTLLEHHPLERGATIRIAVLGSFRGLARVEKAGQDSIELSITERVASLPRLGLTVLVAVPRPQTVKKVISLAVQAGIERLIFVRSYQTVPSYLQSHSLYTEQLRAETYKALEQVWDCTPPQIEVIDKMGVVFDSIVPAFRAADPEPLLLLGETFSERTKPLGEVLSGGSSRRAVIAIGPESGWSPAELDGFARSGFSLVHLDQRQYRVETALSFFIGHFQALAAQGDHRAD